MCPCLLTDGTKQKNRETDRRQRDGKKRNRGGGGEDRKPLGPP